MKKTTPTYQELKEKIKSLEKENLLLKLNAKIFDASPAYIVLISPVGKVLAMNESMLQVLGYTAKQVLGVDYIETFIPEQDRAELTALFTKHANVEETAVNINRVLKKDGKTITVEWHGTPFFDKENNLHAYLGIGIDITDKNEAEKLVQKNAIQLETIVKNYPGGSISLIDKDLKIIFTGGTGYKKHNLNPEVFDGKHIKHAFIPEMYEINEPYLQKCLEGKISEFVVEYQQTFYKNYTYPIVVNNKIEYALLISNDISDLKKHENDLLKTLKEQNIVLDNDPAFIIFKDNKNNILRISETVAKMTGLQKHEIEGKPSKAIYPDMAEKYYADDLEVMKSRKPKRGIIEPLPSVKGEQKWLMTDKVPYFDDNGEVAGIIVFSSDITEIKKTEESLIKAKEKAEESDRLKSAFLANMSHEIRTPMNGVLGFTDLLKEPNLSGEEQQRYIDIIQKSGNRMLSTINDIIEISRIEAGEMRINAVKVNINKHLFTIKNFFYLEAEKKGINVVIDNILPNEDLFIVTDKAKLSSILTNLIKNAIKFTKKGEIRIGCKQDNAFLEFYIKDSGIGIPKDRIDAIFNRFEQADIEDKEAHQGSGLGLTISKSYVEMLGGKIWVESEENKGSTFFFTILFDTPKCETESKQTMPIQAKSIVKKLNLLIVEDDSVSSYYLTTILKDKAENIQIAKDGLEAVEVCKNNPKLDLILMDVKLPGIDGLEATRRIRAFNKKVKIIAQTAHAIEGDKEKAIKAGCDDYISKPISKENLFNLINKKSIT